MSGETDLLPCPFCGEGEHLLVEHLEGTILHPAHRIRCDNCGASTGYTDRGFRADWNARACVSSATEALRAEVAEARDGWHMANGTAELAMKHRDAAEARAERLAEALRDARHAGSLLANIAYNLAQDESLSEPVRWSLDDARKRWDLTTKDSRAALGPARGPHRRQGGRT